MTDNDSYTLFRGTVEDQPLRLWRRTDQRIVISMEGRNGVIDLSPRRATDLAQRLLQIAGDKPIVTRRPPR